MTRLALLALLFPASALAFQVEWDTPEQCPAPALAHSGEGRAEVIVREKAGVWLATVLFFEPTAGLRRVEAASCEEALKAAQLVLELGAQPTSAQPPSPQPETAAPPPAEPPTRHVSLGAGAALDVGSLPLAEPRAVVSVSALLGAVRVAVDARFGVPAPLSSRVQAHRLVELQLAGCAHARLGAFNGGPCLALAGGSWRAASETTSAETFVLSTSAQLRGAWAVVAGFELGALAGLRVNLRRPTLPAGEGAVFTTPLLASELQLTAGWRW